MESRCASSISTSQRRASGLRRARKPAQALEDFADRCGGYEKWDAYSSARDDMFRRTSHPAALWRVVHSDTKKIARLEFLRDLLDGFPIAQGQEADASDRMSSFLEDDAAARPDRQHRVRRPPGAAL
jgi:hypothetical protein